LEELYTEEQREAQRIERKRRRKERSFFQKLLTLANLFYLGSLIFAIIAYIYPHSFLILFFTIFLNKYMLAVYPVLGAFVLFSNLFLFYSRNPIKWIMRIIVSVFLFALIAFLSALMLYNINIIINLQGV